MTAPGAADPDGGDQPSVARVVPEPDDHSSHGASAARGLLLVAGDMRLALAIRSALALAAAVALLVGAALLVDRGIRHAVFPPFLTGGGDTVITQYSGPWISAGAALVLLAGLLVAVAGTDLWRRRRLRRAGSGNPAPVATASPAHAERD